MLIILDRNCPDRTEVVRDAVCSMTLSLSQEIILLLEKGSSPCSEGWLLFFFPPPSYLFDVSESFSCFLVLLRTVNILWFVARGELVCVCRTERCILSSQNSWLFIHSFILLIPLDEPVYTRLKADHLLSRCFTN